MNERYSTYKQPTNIVPFNVMLTKIGFPSGHYDSYEEYTTSLSDSEKLFIIGQAFCKLDNTAQFQFERLLKEGLNVLEYENFMGEKFNDK